MGVEIQLGWFLLVAVSYIVFAVVFVRYAGGFKPVEPTNGSQTPARAPGHEEEES